MSIFVQVVTIVLFVLGHSQGLFGECEQPDWRRVSEDCCWPKVEEWLQRHWLLSGRSVLVSSRGAGLNFGKTAVIFVRAKSAWWHEQDLYEEASCISCRILRTGYLAMWEFIFFTWEAVTIAWRKV